jgi:SAM-dependent methyltransferase
MLMMTPAHSLSLNLQNSLLSLMERPALFEPGEPLFWNDPHIARQMLKAHLDPAHDAASRRPEMIEKTVNWIVSHLHLAPGAAVLDLGCGPGLYATRLAEQGMRVTGIDYSQNSIDYARRTSRERQVAITYLCQDFLTIDYEAQFDLILQVYGELCVFSPAVRDELLQKVHRALKPGGRFVFDVTTRACRLTHGLKNGWYTSEGGFWRPGPHLVLENGFDYPEDDVYLDQYIVIEEGGQMAVYRNWFLDYSAETLTPVLQAQGLHVDEVRGDLAGAPLAENSEWLAVITSKPD